MQGPVGRNVRQELRLCSLQPQPRVGSNAHSGGMTEQPRSPPSAAQLTALYRYPVFNSASLLYPIILIIPECLNYSHSLLCWSVFCLVLSEALPHLSPLLMARALISHGLWNSMLKKSLKIRTKCRGDERKSQN